MEREIGNRWGSGAKVAPISSVTSSQIVQHSQVVLAWPDSIGYGWTWWELKTFFRLGGMRNLRVLTGRNREFSLSFRLWLGFVGRRVMEKAWVGEVVFALGFVLLSPIFVLSDFLRGRA